MNRKRVVTIVAYAIILVLAATLTGCSVHSQAIAEHANDQGISSQEIGWIEQAAPKKTTAVPKRPRKLLVFNLAIGYRHSSIPYAARALEVMGQKTGAFEVIQSEDMSVFLPENINKFDAVCLNSSSQLDFSDPNLRRGLMGFVKAGGGLVGIHGATKNFRNWPEVAEMLGGIFDGHPWHAQGRWTVKIEDPDHSLMAAFKNRFADVVDVGDPNRAIVASFKATTFRINDEIYRIKPVNLRKNCRVLMGLDMTDVVNSGAEGVRPTDEDIPISWVRTFGKGRVFYCSFGHNHHVFRNSAILQHLLDGIRFALADLPADTMVLPKCR